MAKVLEQPNLVRDQPINSLGQQFFRESRVVDGIDKHLESEFMRLPNRGL